MTKLTRKRLHIAMRLGLTEKFRSILDSEGWPSVSKWSDLELLMKAISLKRKLIVHILLDKGGRVTSKLGTTTPLHLAATIDGWSDVVERLLDKGCKVADQRRGNGDTALHLAFLNRSPGSIIDRMLNSHLRENTRNIANKDGLSFLHIACTRPQVHVVEKFIELDANFVNYPNSQTMYTPLHFAVEYQQYQVAKFLLQRGADINQQDRNEMTPLHLALILKTVPAIDLLLKFDSSKKITVDKFGLSHFMAACAGSDYDIVREYLDLAIKSDLSPNELMNSQVKNSGHFAGYTPLHFAADFGRVDTTELLLNYGADCCAITIGGLTVHALARERKHERVCDMLQEHCDLLTKCRQLRAASPDFGEWGENYERAVLIERTRMLKYLGKTLKNVTSMNCSSELSADDYAESCVHTSAVEQVL